MSDEPKQRPLVVLEGYLPKPKKFVPLKKFWLDEAPPAPSAEEWDDFLKREAPPNPPGTP